MGRRGWGEIKESQHLPHTSSFFLCLHSGFYYQYQSSESPHSCFYYLYQHSFSFSLSALILLPSVLIFLMSALIFLPPPVSPPFTATRGTTACPPIRGTTACSSVYQDSYWEQLYVPLFVSVFLTACPPIRGALEDNCLAPLGGGHQTRLSPHSGGHGTDRPVHPHPKLTPNSHGRFCLLYLVCLFCSLYVSKL